MYRIIDARATGKTRELMEIAKENDAILLCSNPFAMEQKARAYGIIGLQIDSYDRFYDESENIGTESFVIDELESFVQYYANAPILGYTLSNED